MLRMLRQGQRWLMAGVIVLVGGVFVLYLGVGGPFTGSGPGTALVEVGERSYGPRDLQRIRESRERQYREALGEAFDPSAVSEQLDAISASELLQLGVLASEAERVGLRVSDAEVRRSVRAIPGAVDEQGRLRREALRSHAEVEYGTERRFVEQHRDWLLRNKLLRLVDAGVDVSRAEARDAVRHRLEEIRLAFVALSEDEPSEGVELGDEQIERFLTEQEPRVRAHYDENVDRFHVPEQVRARHILLRVPADAPPEAVEAVRQRGEEILERLRGGADFADLALELSEDPGSRDQGGDLGFFGPGQMAAAFEEAAFALEPGQLSELVRTPFGFHLLRVEERKPAEDRSFEQARREIARELLSRDAAREAANATAERLAEAIRAGASLVEAARAEGVVIERTDWLRRSREGYVPGLAAAPQVLTLAFSLPEDRPSSDRILRAKDKLVLVERLERREPTSEQVEAELPSELERLLEERRGQARDLWYAAARDRLEAQGKLRLDLSSLRAS